MRTLADYQKFSIERYAGWAGVDLVLPAFFGGLDRMFEAFQNREMADDLRELVLVNFGPLLAAYQTMRAMDALSRMAKTMDAMLRQMADVMAVMSGTPATEKVNDPSAG